MQTLLIVIVVAFGLMAAATVYSARVVSGGLSRAEERQEDDNV